MHLGFITSEYPHTRLGKVGGLGTSIKNLVNVLVKEGVEVSLFIYHQSEDAIFEENGINFHLIKKKAYPVFGWYRYRKLIQDYVNRVVDSESIDALEAPDWTGVTAFMKLNVPLVIRFHGSDTYFCNLDGRKQKWKNKWFESNAVKRASAFIAPTTFAGTESARLFNIDPKRVKTIHYGLNLELFDNPYPEKYSKFRMVNVGTLIRKKGVFQLAEVFNKVSAKYPESELYLIGGDAADLETGTGSTWILMQDVFTPAALDRVHYLGKVPYEEVKDHIMNAHVCVFPSLAETLGMVTIESMAMKKAVVNTSYGWAEELIDHDINGFKIDPNDIDGYADCISQLFNSPGRALQIGENARRKVEETFDIRKKVIENIQFYKELTGK